MGVWGGVCVFDEWRYEKIVAPALRAGAGHRLVRGALALIDGDRPGRRRPAFDGLEAVARTFDPLLIHSPLGRGFAVRGGDIARERGADPGAWGYEELAELFERLVTAAAVSAYAVMGLSFASCRQLLPPELGLSPVSAIQVGALDDSLSYWAHGSGGYGEGLRGWLGAAHAARLLAELEPRFGPGAAPDERLRAYCAEAGADEGWHRGRIELFLAALREARARGFGLLWGRDLRLFYEPARCVFPGDPPKADLARRP